MTMISKEITYTGWTGYDYHLHRTRDLLISKYQPACYVQGAEYVLLSPLPKFLSALPDHHWVFGSLDSDYYIILIDWGDGFCELKVEYWSQDKYRIFPLVGANNYKLAKLILSRLKELVHPHQVRFAKGLLNVKQYIAIDGSPHNVDFYDTVTETFTPLAYPYIQDIPSFFQGFKDTQSTVLLLHGPPGTGKTKFIRWMLAEITDPSRTVIAYVTDPEVVDCPDFYLEIMLGKFDYVVMEDISHILTRPRTDSIIRILSLSDGLTSNRTKFIFACNTRLADIDPALVRPGRCYSVVEFRPLHYNEAVKLANFLNVSLPEKRDYTLGEIYNLTDLNRLGEQRTLGF